MIYCFFGIPLQKNNICKKSKRLNFNIFVMNKIDEKDVFNGGKYLPPDIKIVEIKVEKGFAQYDGGTGSEGGGDETEGGF